MRNDSVSGMSKPVQRIDFKLNEIIFNGWYDNVLPKNETTWPFFYDSWAFLEMKRLESLFSRTLSKNTCKKLTKLFFRLSNFWHSQESQVWSKKCETERKKCFWPFFSQMTQKLKTIKQQSFSFTIDTRVCFLTFGVKITSKNENKWAVCFGEWFCFMFSLWQAKWQF